MTFTIRPARRSDSMALIGLYSQSGAGKTYSALLLARGLVGPQGKIVFIDTEEKRGSLYADVIPGGYQTIDLGAPFTPARYIEALEAAEKGGAECVIIDSMSHEWEGIGGVGDMADAIERSTGKPGLHCWKEPKKAHQKMLLKLLQAKAHLIVCLRAKRKSRQTKDDKGKTVIVKDDFYTPKQDADFIFEMQVHAEILQDHRLKVTKVSHPQLATIFRDGVMISEDTGRALAEWTKGGNATAPNTVAAPAAVQAQPSGELDEQSFPPFDGTSRTAFVAYSKKYLAEADDAAAHAWEANYRTMLADMNKHANARIVAAAADLLELYTGRLVPAEQKAAA